MTKKISLMKKIACAAGIALLMAGSARASVVFSTDFEGVGQTTSSNDITLGGATPDVVAGEFFGSNQTSGVGGGDLSLDVGTANRFRGTGVWIDTTGFEAGPIVATVDVSDFVSADTELFFQAFGADGVDALNSVSLDLHAGTNPADGNPLQTGTATINAIGDRQAITGDGTAVPFTFDFNGTDDFVALTFNISTGATLGSATLDNLSVDATLVSVPEPSSLALLTAGFGLIGLRRRRQN